MSREWCMEKRKPEAPEDGVDIFDNTVLCERCRSGEREEALLLCDGTLDISAITT